MKMPQTEEAKKKQEELKNENQNQKSEREIVLEAQLQVLQTQFEQEKNVRDTLTDKAEAEAAKLLEEQLKEKTNIKNLLDAEKKTSADDDDGLSQNELIDVIAGAIETSAEARSQQMMTEITKMVKGSDDKIEKTQKALLSVVANLQVQQARKTFPDFDEHRDEIEKVMNQYPAMEIEDAVILAKTRKAGKSTPKKKVETERPSNVPTRDGGGKPSLDEHISDVEDRQQRQGKTTGHSRMRNLRDIISEGIDKVRAAREHGED